MQRFISSMLLVFSLLFPAWSTAVNTHGTPDVAVEQQSWFGDAFAGYVAAPASCLPTVPVSSLTIGAFACKAYVRDTTLKQLTYVDQTSKAVGPLNSGNGTYWILLHKSTTASVAGWTRQVGTHYLWQKSATQPATPSSGLIIAQVTVAGSVITAVQPLGSRSPVDAHLSLINVMDYGANPDDAVDDTAAFLTAISMIRGDASGGMAYTAKGAGCLYLPLPQTLGGHYRVSSILDFSEKWNLCIIVPARYSRNRDVGANRVAIIKWYGATGQPVVLLSENQSVTTENLSIDCLGVAGTIGLAIAPSGDATNSQKYQTHTNTDVQYCDVGIRVGDFAANGPDAASIEFVNAFVDHNVSQGFTVNSGNALVHTTMLTTTNNGYAPTGGKRGANVYLGAGQLTISGYHSAGQGATIPVDADIYMDGNGLNIFGAWSDTHGIFLNASGAAVSGGVAIHGLRHYEGGMTIGNTPTSILFGGASTLVIGSSLVHGNIQIDAGNNSHVIDLGTRFQLTGATFTGVGVTTGRGLMSLGRYLAAEARLEVGRPGRTDVGTTQPTTLWGLDNRPLLILSTSDTDSALTLMTNASAGNIDFCFNCYYDGSNFKAIKAGPVGRFIAQGSTDPNLAVWYQADAAAPGEVLGLNKLLLSTKLVAYGAGTVPHLLLGDGSTGFHREIWTTAAPTSGTWTRGDVAWNLNAASGAPQGWRCTVSGVSGGTWVAMPNL